MRSLRIAGLDVPDVLSRALDMGRLVIFAGAGVSIPRPSNYPDFKRLADEIGSQAGVVRLQGEPDERYLGRLAARGVHVAEMVRDRLSASESQPTSLHRDIVRLFRGHQAVRLITTNFDTHFSTAIRDVYADLVPQYEAPALPGGADFRGLLYLHGVVDRPETLVLTDVDFGRAYLTDGWARRFLVKLLTSQELTVLFIGYSGQDPPFRYVTRALPSDGTTRHCALTQNGEVEEWNLRGIAPIGYDPGPAGAQKHRAAARFVREWAADVNRTIASRRARMAHVLSGEPPADIEQEGYLLEYLKDPVGRRLFVDGARGATWLEWALGKGLLDGLRAADELGDDALHDFASWIANLVCQAPAECLPWLLRSGVLLDRREVWERLRWALVRGPEGMPSRLRAILVSILIEHQPRQTRRHVWTEILETLKFPEEVELGVRVLCELLRPRFVPDKFGREARLEATEDQDGVGDVWERLRPSFTPAAGELLGVLEGHLRLTSLTLRASGAAHGMWDPISYARSAIEPHEQNHRWAPLSSLLDVARDCLEDLLKVAPENARFLIERWVTGSECPLLVRLAVHATGRDERRSPSEKVEWLMKHSLVSRMDTKHEVFQVLAGAFGGASEDVRRRFLGCVEKSSLGGDGSAIGSLDQSDTRAYETYNLLLWLARSAPNCQVTASTLQRCVDAHPTFKPRAFPDLDHWVAVSDGAWPEGPSAADLLQMEPRDLARSSIRPTELSKAVAENPDWSWRLVAGLRQEGCLREDVWHPILRGWAEAGLDSSGWDNALDYLLGSQTLVEALVMPVSSFLRDSIRHEPPALPPECDGKAVALARLLCDLVRQQGEVAPELSERDGWVSAALNQPIGVITHFAVLLAQRRYRGLGSSKADLSTDLRELIGAVLGGNGRLPMPARAMLAASVGNLWAIDAVWAEATVLPLLDWSVDEPGAEAAWHGFLAWGRWNRPLLPGLLPFYQQTCQRIERLPGDLRVRFADHIASIALYGGCDTLREPWFREFLLLGGTTDRVNWARAIGQALRGLEEEPKREIWNVWLDAYWRQRHRGVPLPLDPKEVLAMLDWLPHLQPVFSTAVERACDSPIPRHRCEGMLFYAIEQAGLATLHPEPLSRFLQVVLPRIDAPFFEGPSLRRVILALKEAGVATSELDKLLRQGIRIGVFDSSVLDQLPTPNDRSR